MSKYKNHPAYIDSGVDWLGAIPKTWGVKKIKFVFVIKKRIAGELGHQVLAITQKGIKIKDTESGKGQVSMDYSKYQLVEAGDFAMNHMDLLTGYVDISDHLGVTSPDYRVFVLNDKESFSKYFLYLFQMGYTNKIFYSYGQGSSQLGRWRFQTEPFKNFYMPYPRLDEQQKITCFLDYETVKIDQLIEKQKKLIELLNEKRLAVISHAVTKGINPNVKMKDTSVKWLGEVPVHWNIKKLKFLSFCIPSNVDKKTKEGEKFVLLCNYTDVYYNDKITSEIEFMKASATNEQIEKFTLQQGDVIVTKDSEDPNEIAIPSVVPKKLTNVICGYHLAIIRSSNKNSGSYIKYLFDSIYARSVFSVTCNGLTRFGLGTYALKNILFPQPAFEEQKKIADFLDYQTDKNKALIEKSKKMIKFLEERRTALISSAITGKIDVRNWQANKKTAA